MNDLIQTVREAVENFYHIGSPEHNRLVNNAAPEWLRQLCDQVEALQRSLESTMIDWSHTEIEYGERLEAQAKEIERLNQKVEELLDIPSNDELNGDIHRLKRDAVFLDFEYQKLKSENAELRDEIERWKTRCQINENNGHTQYSERKRIEEQRDAAVTALEWYADRDNHEIMRRIGGDFAPITLDKGKRARDALSHIKGGETE